MATPQKSCAMCGAPITRKEMTVCASCGTPYSFQGSAAEKPPKEIRFSKVEELPQYEELTRRDPPKLPSYLRLAFPIVLGVVLAYVAKSFRSWVLAEDSATLLVVLTWVVTVGVLLGGVVLFLAGCVKLFQFASAPLIRRPALITRKRTIKEGGNPAQADGKPLIIHLEFRTENRDEVRAGGALARDMTVGEMGMVYVKGPLLLDYESLDA